MKRYKGVVFFDYDGTLIDEVDGIFHLPASAKEALKCLHRNGYAACVCTGRSKQFSEDVKDYFDGYVTAMGAYVEMDGEIVQSTVILDEEIERMRAICRERDIVFLMDGEKQSYCDGMDTDQYQFFRRVFDVRDPWVLPWDTKERCRINKLTYMYHDISDYEFLWGHFSEQLELAKHIRYSIADATPKGVNKGTGIKKILEYLNLPVEASYGFGDGDNDLSLIQTVGTGVIMGRHYKGLEPYAAFTTGLVKEDGIYHGLKRLGLI